MVRCEGYSATLDVPASPDPLGYVASAPIELRHHRQRSPGDREDGGQRPRGQRSRPRWSCPGRARPTACRAPTTSSPTRAGHHAQRLPVLPRPRRGRGLRCAGQQRARSLSTTGSGNTSSSPTKRQRRSLGQLHQPDGPEPGAPHVRDADGARPHCVRRLQPSRARTARHSARSTRCSTIGIATTRNASPASPWSGRRCSASTAASRSPSSSPSAPTARCCRRSTSTAAARSSCRAPAWPAMAARSYNGRFPERQPVAVPGRAASCRSTPATTCSRSQAGLSRGQQSQAFHRPQHAGESTDQVRPNTSTSAADRRLVRRRPRRSTRATCRRSGAGRCAAGDAPASAKLLSRGGGRRVPHLPRRRSAPSSTGTASSLDAGTTPARTISAAAAPTSPSMHRCRMR